MIQHWYLSAINPVFSVTGYDPSEIIFICWFIISVETVVLLNIFWEPVIIFFDE